MFTGWLRLNPKQWRPVLTSNTQLECEEAIAAYKIQRDLTLESVVLPSGLEPHPCHSVK